MSKTRAKVDITNIFVGDMAHPQALMFFNVGNKVTLTSYTLHLQYRIDHSTNYFTAVRSTQLTTDCDREGAKFGKENEYIQSFLDATVVRRTLSLTAMAMQTPSPALTPVPSSATPLLFLSSLSRFCVWLSSISM
jgi:hypothetical protein